MTQQTKPGVFAGWTLDRTINVPLLVMAVGAIATGAAGLTNLQAGQARNQQDIGEIKQTLKELASYQRSVNQLEVRVGANERAITTLQQDVKEIR